MHQNECLQFSFPLSCSTVPPAHWVPDMHSWTCSSCGDSFNAFNRRHHCRCCGGIFCDACCSNRVPLPGWGITKAVRVCEDCKKFELVQLPILLAGDVWIKPDKWSDVGQTTFLRLSADQSLLLWTPWRSDEGSDNSTETSADISRLTCVSELPDRLGLVLSIDGGERLTFEGASCPVSISAGSSI